MYKAYVTVYSSFILTPDYFQYIQQVDQYPQRGVAYDDCWMILFSFEYSIDADIQSTL